VNYDDETNQLMSQYTVIAKTKQYVIIDLTHPLPKPTETKKKSTPKK
jgi:hypothetical protein